MKTVVDQDACIGCGLCPSIASEVYEMREDGKAHEMVDSVPEKLHDDVKEAAESCPVNAIAVEE